MNHVEMLVELQALIAEYWASVDRITDVRRSSASFYVDKGEMVLGSLHVRGRENLEAFFSSRNEKELANRRSTRHFAANLRLEARGPQHATVYALVLVHAGCGDHPLPSEPPAAIGDFSFACVRDPARGWLFEKVSGSSVFVGAGAASFAKGSP